MALPNLGRNIYYIRKENAMRTRCNSVGLWLSDMELAHLKKQCQITGLNTNTYLRKLIMGEHLCPRPPDAYAALLRELSAIGNNVNQIAHWTNGKGYATQAEIREAVNLVKQAYRSILDTL